VPNQLTKVEEAALEAMHEYVSNGALRFHPEIVKALCSLNFGMLFTHVGESALPLRWFCLRLRAGP